MKAGQPAPAEGAGGARGPSPEGGGPGRAASPEGAESARPAAAEPARAAAEGPRPLARVAIVGRPNVGKSTLLNRMVQSRVSIVEPTSGVTRDRVSVPVRLRSGDVERWVEVTDTGGIGIVDRHDLGPEVERQVDQAVRSADLILFLVDARDGLVPLDQEVARRLRGAGKPVVLAANKAEARAAPWVVEEFRRLGVGADPIAISAQNAEGLDELYGRILALLPEEAGERPAPGAAVLKLAVVGQRNSGKSTLVNAFAREARMIVSEIPGTTRDAVDVRFERGGRTFVAIDTAGLRKRSSLSDAVEFFSDARSHRTVRRADVVALLFDVTQPLSSVDKKIASYALERYKPLILAANKWDLVSHMDRGEFEDYLRAELPGLSFAPIRFLSAREGTGVEELLATAEELFDESRRRAGTGELNRALERAVEARAPGKEASRVRIYYGTQAGVAPPTFVLFVNDKDLVGKQYLRYIQNRLREELGFARVPLRLVLKGRKEEKEKGRR